MSTTLHYDLKAALPFLTKDNRWNVLTVLILHANIRNRCWPSMEVITELGTNGNRTKATRAKKWLEDHKAFEIVPGGKRVAEEAKIPSRQHIYQLLGTLQACDDKTCDCGGNGRIYGYIYANSERPDGQTIDTIKRPDGQTFNNLNGDTIKRLNGDTLSILPELEKKEEKKNSPKNPSKTKRQILIEKLMPYSGIAHTILSLIEEGYSGEMNTPDSYMTIPHMEKYLPHLEELARLDATPEELKCLYVYFKPIYDKGEWTIGVKTFVEKLQPYRTIKAKSPAPRPAAPIIEDTPPATPEERAALLAAMADIRPEWEKSA